MRVPHDTSHAAREQQLAAYRQMSPAKRVALAFEMSEEAIAVMTAGVRARHPEWSEWQVAQARRELLLGTDLARSIPPTSA